MDDAHGDYFNGGHYADEEVFGIDDAAMNDGPKDLPRTDFIGAGSSSCINPWLVSLDLNYDSDWSQMGLGQPVPPRSASRSLSFNPPHRVDTSILNLRVFQSSSSRMAWIPGGPGGTVSSPGRYGYYGSPPSLRMPFVLGGSGGRGPSGGSGSARMGRHPRPRAARPVSEDVPDQQQYVPDMDGFH